MQEVVDNYKLLKKLRSRGKSDANLLIKQKVRQADDKKEMEKFNQIMKQKRLQHSQGNPVHLKRKDSHMPMLKIKQDFSKEVPEYLKELAESGIDIN